MDVDRLKGIARTAAGWVHFSVAGGRSNIAAFAPNIDEHPRVIAIGRLIYEASLEAAIESALVTMLRAMKRPPSSRLPRQRSNRLRRLKRVLFGSNRDSLSLFWIDRVFCGGPVSTSRIEGRGRASPVNERHKSATLRTGRDGDVYRLIRSSEMLVM